MHWQEVPPGREIKCKYADTGRQWLFVVGSQDGLDVWGKILRILMLMAKLALHNLSPLMLNNGNSVFYKVMYFFHSKCKWGHSM